MEEKTVSEVQDLFEQKLSRLGAELKGLGVLIQCKAESGIVLNEEEWTGLGWLMEDMGAQIRDISDQGVDLCLGRPKWESETGQPELDPKECFPTIGNLFKALSRGEYDTAKSALETLKEEVLKMKGEAGEEVSHD